MYYIIGYLKTEYTDELAKMLGKIDDSDIMIHLYQHQENSSVDPSIFLAEIERITREQGHNAKFIFMTDINNLMEIVYRAYHQIFDNFIFYAAEPTNVPLSEPFQKLYELPIKKEEMLYKQIYSNEVAAQLLMEELNPKIVEIEFASIRREHTEEELQKVYIIDGENHVFEPTLGREVWINGEANYAIRMNYHYAYNRELHDAVVDAVLQRYFLRELPAYNELVTAYSKERYEQEIQYKMTWLAIYYSLEDKKFEHEYFAKIYVYSFLLDVFPQRDRYQQLLLLINGVKEQLTTDQLNFLCHQLDFFVLTHLYLHEDDSILNKIQEEVISRESEKYQKELVRIPREDRNSEEVIVLVGQFLSIDHPPTKTALERIRTLQKELGKHVTVLSVKECSPLQGYVPFYGAKGGNLFDEYSYYNTLTYKDCTFDIYQPIGNTRDEAVIIDILNRVKQIRPEYAIYIGNFSVISELVGQIVPVAHTPVTFTRPLYKKNGCMVLGKYYSEEEKQKMQMLGYDMSKLVESTFTFELAEQKKKLSRKELGLPEDKFLCVIIGRRLTQEITQDFIKAMQGVLEQGIHFVFAGLMEHYELLCKVFPYLEENSTFVGYCDDVLALTEVCDLYVNPKRLGGGFSVIESFIQHKPGITLNYGDVSGAVGPLFRVNSYEEMAKTIIRYANDQEFYNQMAEKAYERALECTDSKGALVDIIDKVKKHEYYF